MIIKEKIQKFLGIDPESQTRKARLSASRVKLFHKSVPYFAKAAVVGGVALFAGEAKPAQAAGNSVVRSTDFDGELVLTMGRINKETGRYDRQPVGEAERADIVEISWPSPGFGGFQRAILEVPRLGPVWQVNVKDVSTVASWGFLGKDNEVVKWMKEKHGGQLMQASRDPKGNEPRPSEIFMGRLHYEEFPGQAAGLIVVQEADGFSPIAEEVIAHLDLSFHEGSIASNTPIRAVRK